MLVDILDKNLQFETCGAKAKNLQIMASKGLNVPYGKVIPMSYYHEYMRCRRESSCRENIQGKMRSLLHKVWCEIERDVQKPVILRSSTCEEDGECASCAGIYQSSKPIDRYHDFANAIFEVWDSYDSVQAIKYRNDNGQAETGMAVIVQTWIVAEMRGVLFSCDPRDGTEKIIIESAGGESDVDSAPYTHRIVIEDRIVTVERGDSNFINEKMLQSLCDAMRHIYNIMGCHVDVEWVWKEKLFIVQARPITTMELRNTRYYCWNSIDETINGCLIDRYSQPATPAYLSLLDSWQDRVYLDMHSNVVGGEGNMKPLLFYYNRVYWNLDYQAEQYDVIYKDLEEVKNNDSFLYNLIITGADKWYARIDGYERDLDRVKSVNLSDLSEAELSKVLSDILGIFCDGIGVDHYQMLGLANICYTLFQRMLDTIPDNNARVVELLKSGQQNQTIRSNDELYNIAEYFCSIPTTREWLITESVEEIYKKICENIEYSAIREKISDFLNRHGHRGTGCDDLYYPHWADSPIILIKLLKQYCMLIINKEEGKKQNAEQRVFQSDNIKELNEINDLTSKYMNLREDQRYYFDKSWIVIRKIYLEIGMRMVRSGRIDEPEDVFFTYYDELIAWLEDGGHSITNSNIKKRKKIYHQLQRSKPPYFIKNGKILQVQKIGKHRSYKVTVVSSGYALGRARYVTNADDLLRVEQGEILIVPTFHPSWTPVLGVASGIVMSYGNILSHGAVVAREYGVPVVIYNDFIDEQICNGALVEIDGIQGRLRIARDNKDRVGDELC